MQEIHGKDAKPVEVRLASNGVTIITPPYLDARINPADLNFNHDYPDRSLLAPEKNADIKMAYLTASDGRKLSYFLYAVLGEGSFGKVTLAQDEHTGEWVAIKHVNTKVTDATYQAEIDSLAVVNALIDYNTATQTTIMRLLPGQELFFALVDRVGHQHAPQHFSLLQRIAIAKEVMKRAAGMHKDVELIKNPQLREEVRRILHRDLKPNNMLLDPATNTILFCDYGMAAELPAERKRGAGIEGVQGTLMGTPGYLAPEILDNRSTYTTYNEATEVYALGMALGDVLNLTRWSLLPRFTKSHGLLHYLVIRRATGHVPKELVQLIKEMTDDDPNRRPSVINAAQRLNKILFAQAKKEGLKVSTLSIREFLNGDKKSREKVIKALIRNKINAVALTSLQGENVSLQDYYQVRYELIKAGIINVTPFMTKGATQEDNIRVVKDHYDATYATLHSKVFHYQDGKFVDKTPAPHTISVETERYAVVRRLMHDEKDVVKKMHKKIVREMHYVINHAKYIDGMKKKDLEVMLQLPSCLKAEELIPFVHALENAYLRSLKSAKTLFGPRVTAAMINKASIKKYALPRTLGLMLKSVYERLDQLLGEQQQWNVSGVMHIEDVNERNKKLQQTKFNKNTYTRL